ncbi:MAG: PepSY-associated TM helix domain-containing protein [Vicinamibacterales bacterium]
MPTFRTALFWCHLVAGLFAGVVVLIMSITGVALTYEKQMLEWADRRAWSVPPPDGVERLGPETLLAQVREAKPEAAPTTLTLRADPAAPASVGFDRGVTLLVDPYTGAVIGPPPSGLRSFFRTMTSWHRWLALDGDSRGIGKAVTGASNLAFLFIVISGIYLWIPRIWTRLQVRNVLWFRSGLAPKARDFNWHNVIGIWSAIPLAIVVAGAVPISYPWASALVYRVVGEDPPQGGRPGPPGAGPARGAGGGPGREGARASEGGGREGGESRGPGPRSNRGRGADAGADAARTPEPLPLTGLDAGYRTARAQVPSWRAITVRLPGEPASAWAFTIDEGYGGQPQRRGTLTVSRSGAVDRWETFADQSAGRRLRSWLRFAHTGEYYGLVGQTIAGAVSLGGVVLVWTGLALAWRRFVAWRARRRQATLRQAA